MCGAVGNVSFVKFEVPENWLPLSANRINDLQLQMLSGIGP